MITRRFNDAQSVYLDFARALAAMFVTIGHLSSMFLQGSALAHADIQAIAVLVFFLLSGFLISTSVFQKHNDHSYGFREFFIDRFCRIFCAFIPALFFVSIVDHYSLIQYQSLPSPSPERYDYLVSVKGMVENSNIQTWFGNLLMLQNFPAFQILKVAGIEENDWFVQSLGSAAAFWTINVEWWLYIFFGVLVYYFFKKDKPSFIHIILLAATSFLPLYYAIGGMLNCLTPLWITGCLVSLFYIHFPREYLTTTKAKNYILILCLVFAVLLVGRIVGILLDLGKFYPGEYQFGIYLAGLLFCPFFLLEFVRQVPQWLAKVIRFFANYSYSLYLTHFTTATAFYVFFPGHDNSPGFFALTVLLANLTAIVFWWLFERHYRVIANYLKNNKNHKFAELKS